MVKKIVALLFISAVLLRFFSVAAQDQKSPFLFEQLTAKNGLPGNATTVTFQDSRYFLWIGTEHGLVRFDGRFYKHYNQIGEGGITDRIITCITEDAKGNIWIGTEAGLNKLNPATNQITQYHEGSGPGSIPFRWCNVLFTDSKKQLWLTTEKGIALYNEEQNTFINHPVILHGRDEKINKFINQIAEDNKGNFWMSSSYGVKKFNPSTKKYQSYLQPGTQNFSPGENAFFGLCISKQGTIWAITYGGQLFRYNAVTDKLETIFTSTDKLMRFTNMAGFGKGNEDNSLLIATTNGLLFFKTPDQQTAPELMLSGIHLSKINKDRQENLWLSSTSGLFRYNASAIVPEWYTLPGMEKPYIFHIIPVIGSIDSYFLTTTTGWYIFNHSIKSVTSHSLPVDDNELLKNLNRYTTDADGYWFTSEKGFGYYNLKKNQLTDLKSIVIRLTGQAATGHVTKATDSQLWFTARRSGIVVYNFKTKKDTLLFGNKEEEGNVFGKNVTDLKSGPDGKIWFTAAGKLYIVDPITLSYKTYKPEGSFSSNNKTDPYHILFTSDGRAIINSVSSIYEFKNHRLQKIYPIQGLFNFSLYRLLENEKGEIWASTDDGLYKTSKQFSSWKSLKYVQGVENESSVFEINLSLRGSVIMASEGRLGVLNESMLEQKNSPHPVIISRIRFGEKEEFLHGPGTTYRCGLKEAVEIELAAPDFSSEKNNSILYRLDGWDKEWKTLTGQNTLRYEQLPPGNYTFSAVVVNANGVQSAAATVSFRVIPPFYRTWWFIALLIAVVASLAFLFYRYRLRKALELEKMRTRIATDLHDDIGATLSSISMYSDVLKKQVKDNMPHLAPVLDKIGESSREMVTGMSDIVWAINPENDSGDKLLQRMENYATDMCALKNIQIHFKADEKVKNAKLSLEKRKNIYLVFKEAVNNAVKYSVAANIYITIQQGSGFLMCIKDDGVGFDIDSIRKGNGLKNFQLRAEEIHGKMAVKSNPGSGTEITLTCDA